MNKRNIDLSSLLKGEERQDGVKVILEVIVENFPNMMQDIMLQVKEMVWIPSWKNIDKTIHSKIVKKTKIFPVIARKKIYYLQSKGKTDAFSRESQNKIIMSYLQHTERK